MIPLSENDSTVFEVNVLIVHFSFWCRTSGTLHQRWHAYSTVFAQLPLKIKKKENEKNKTNNKNTKTRLMKSDWFMKIYYLSHWYLIKG